MARNRMIKPEFFGDRKLSRLSRDCRLLFVGMWCFSDDYGSIQAKSRWLLANIFEEDDSVTELMITSWIKELEDSKIIIRYDADDKQYFQIKSWSKHQKVDRPSKRRNPSFDESLIVTRETVATVSTIKEKEKEKEKEESINVDKSTCYSFDQFWTAYDRKGNKKTSEQRYSKIKESDRELIKSNVSKYIIANPDKQFRKDAQSWLHMECWNDEVVEQSQMNFNKHESVGQLLRTQGDVKIAPQKLDEDGNTIF